MKSKNTGIVGRTHPFARDQPRKATTCSTIRVMDGTQALRDSIKATPDLSVLVVAHEFPDFLLDHSGAIVFFGGQSPRAGLACQRLLYHRAHTTGEVLQAFDVLDRTNPAASFDIVFIDHNHALGALVEQLNRASDFTHGNSVYLFDDAVPPEFSMAGPVPTQDWWVGEVWMLPHLLRNQSSVRDTWSIAVEPTGLLICVGVGALSAAGVDSDYAKLQGVSSLEQLLSHVMLVEVEVGLGRLRSALHACGGLSTHIISIASGSEGADSSVQLDDSKFLPRPPLDFVLDLSGGDVDVSSLYEQHMTLPYKRLDTYSDVLLTGLDTFVAKDSFYCNKIVFAADHAMNVVRNIGYTRTILKRSGEDLVLPDGAGEHAIPIDNHIFFGTPDEPGNWGMWILYVVPSAYQFLKQRDSYDCFFTCLEHSWQRRLLHHLGLAPHDLKEQRLESTYSCTRLSQVRYELRNLAVNHVDRAIFREIAEGFSGGGHIDYGERIYIARNLHGNTHHGRRLLNEQELADKLQERGFTLIQPETLEFPEQVRAFAGARTIVGLGGAGMFNSVFARPGAQVVSIESSTSWAGSHVNMFTSVGLSCGVIIGHQDSADPEPVHKRWQLNVDAAIRQIDQYLS